MRIRDLRTNFPIVTKIIFRFNVCCFYYQKVIMKKVHPKKCGSNVKILTALYVVLGSIVRTLWVKLIQVLKNDH